MNEKITAPWTRRQVATLNEFQQSNLMHPFTCGQRDQHPHNGGVLIATPAGWRCPAYGCRYVQDWAHAFMADGKALARMRATSPFRHQADPECSPEQEIAELREDLASARRKLGAAKAEVAQTRQQLRSAEDELGRLRRALVERPADEARFAVALEALTAALNHDQEYVLLADRERAARAVVAALNGMAWAA